MDMSTFWATVTNKLTAAEVKKQYPAAAMAAKEEEFKGGQYAFSGIPNIGPSGATTEADDADLDERDPDQEITDADGPSLGGDKSLMVYLAKIDELYLWTDGKWLMWNY